MHFGQVSVSDAMGAILAHSLRTSNGVFKKGRLLSVADVEILAASGYREITVAELDADDIAEDIAAARIAAALAGSGVRIGTASGGRVNLHAEAHGIVCVDARRIEAANAVDEAITLATRPPYLGIGSGQMVAAVEIIPFAAPAKAVEAVEQLLAGEPAITVAPFAKKRVALISTQFAETGPEVLDESRSAIVARVEPLGSSVVHEARVRHDAGALTEAIRAARDTDADLILVFGARPAMDRQDVVPAALLAAGGEITRFGMPVDPGSRLLLGKLGSATIVSLPARARSPQKTGFDFVLERLLANVHVGSAEIAAMGVGGLLPEASDGDAEGQDAEHGS
jgi:molybdenum cofactor cytidylyltransferase